MINEPSHLVFAALADPTRRLLFQRLCEEGSGTATSLATRLPMTRQAVTKHLVTLTEAGLVTVHETGRERRYVPQPESLQAVTTWIATVESRWDRRLAVLRSYLLDEPRTQSALETTEHTIAASSAAPRKERIHNMTKTIEKEYFINATPQRVFQALTEKAEMERWFVRNAEVDLRPGGATRFEWAPDMVEMGKILVCEPPHRLSYTWEAFSPAPTTIIFTLAAENDGTRLHFIHTDIGEDERWGNYATGMSHGWDIHLKNLTTWIETGICPPPGPTKSL